MRVLIWISAIFFAALAFPLYRDLNGPVAHWPLEMLAAHVLGGTAFFFCAAAVIPMLAYDISRLCGRAPRFPFVMWAVLLALLVGLSAYGG